MNLIKLKTHKSMYINLVAFLDTNHEHCKKEIQKVIPFMIASERIKYLAISLTKESKDLTLKK